MKTVILFLKILAAPWIFGAAFFLSITMSDRLYERSLQANLHRIEAGMSEAEVIAILGEPTSKNISDIPGIYWCYGSSTWQRRLASDIYCGSVLIEMSSIKDGHVVRPPSR